jgi:nondiscriminating glutamyl-tRNA synthetase
MQELISTLEYIDGFDSANIESIVKDWLAKKRNWNG